MNNERIRRLLNDIKVELSQEFDKNFSRKAFFTEKWPERKSDGKGTLMVQTGKLRRSLIARTGERSVTWTSSEAYAGIHNTGGKIKVTKKMKKFFWAKYYDTGGKIKYKKDGSTSKTSIRLSEEAEMWRAMALMKVGDEIIIPKRQFIGASPEVKRILQQLIAANLKGFEKDIKYHLKDTLK